ncbi:MAG: hypothetical protein ACQEQF_02220 [Bacillota bacterium]
MKTINKKSELPKSLKIFLGYASMKSKEEDIKKIFNKADQEMYKNKEKTNL